MRTIDVSKGYDKLSEKDKLHLLQRDRLPAQYVTPELRAQIDQSGRASTVAYGGNTGTIANLSEEELEAELARRRADNPPHEDDDDLTGLMPDLENPHSERLSQIERNQEETGKTQHKRDAAAHAARSGPQVPTRGHPAADAASLTALSSADDEDDDEDDDEEEEDYSGTEWTKTALLEELTERGLDDSDGTKAELRDRLLAADSSDEEE